MAIRRGGSRSNSRQITIEILGDDRQARRAFEAAQKASQDFGSQMERMSRQVGENVRGDLDSLLRWGRNAALAITGVVTAIGALALKGGIDRALNIEDAQAKLRGLGHDAESVEKIMTSALDAVRGTAFGLDEAATIAAQAVAAGVKPGEDLTRVLKLTADAATIAGVPLSEMGQIFGQVLANGRAMTQELNRLQDRGIPIIQWLADEFGVTNEAMRKMVADGVVDSQTYLKAIENNIAGAALASGETTRGAFANMRAAMSRFGEAMVRELFPIAKEVFGGIGEGFDNLTARIRPFIQEFTRSDFFRGLVDQVGRIPEFFDRAVEAVTNLWDATAGLRDLLANTVSGAIELFREFLSDVFSLNDALNGIPGILAAVAAGLALVYAHPVIGGLALTAAAIGTLTKESREAKEAARELGEEYFDLIDVLERGELLTSVLSPEELRLLDEAGVRISDLIDGSVSFAEALERVQEGLQFKGAGVPRDLDLVRIFPGTTAAEQTAIVDSLVTNLQALIDAEAEHNAALAEEAELSRAAGRAFDRAGGAGRRWREGASDAREMAAAVEEARLRTEAMDEAIAELAQTWGTELNKEVQGFLTIFEEAPEIESQGIDALQSNLEARIELVNRWLEGLERLREEGLTSLVEEFRGRGVEGVGDLEAVIRDLDEGGTRAFQLEETLGAARSAGESVTAEMGIALAAEAATLYAQAEDIGEGVVDALARGVSGGRVRIDMDIVTSARIQAAGRLAPGASGGGAGGATPRATGGRADPFEAYLVGDGGRTEVLQMGARGGFIHPSVESFLASMVPQMAGGGGGTTIQITQNISGTGARQIAKEAIRELDRELEVFQRGMHRPL